MSAQERVALRGSERAAAIAELELHNEFERRECARSLEAFLYRYLPAQFHEAPGEFHRNIYHDLERFVFRQEVAGEVRLNAAYAYPRGHGKTTTVTLGFLLWVISEWRNMEHFEGKPPFILIVSDTLTQARDRAMDLRDEVEANGQLIQDYGFKASMSKSDDAGSKNKWTETDWITRDGVRVKAVGSGSKVRGLLRKGRRPTLIVCDDLENDEQVATKLRRQKLERWLQKALIPTGIEGKLLTVVVGTILHADSLLSRLLNDEFYPGWLKRRFAALYSKVGLPDPEGTVPLWPEYWPVWKLMQRKRSIGSVAFTQEYLNQAIDEATALFKRIWLNRAKNRGSGLSFLYGPAPRIPFEETIKTWSGSDLKAKFGEHAYQAIFTAWDLSIVADEKKAQERNSDYTVGTTLCLNAMDKVVVRRIYKRRGMTPAEIRQRIIAEQKILQSDYIVVENNAAQAIYEIDLRAIPGLPIIGHTTGTKKHSVYEGVPGMAYLFEYNRIDFANTTEQEVKRIDGLIDELHGLGFEAHDDMVMSLWIGLSAIRKWQYRRDQRRKKLVGPAPEEYVGILAPREEAA